MTVIRGHIIELMPNNKQITYFKKACGVSRFAYNWALAEWQRQYDADKSYRNDCLAKGIEVDKSKLNSPDCFKLRKQFNAIKKLEFPFVMEVTKCSPEEAIIQLGKAFSNFFEKRAKYPKFKKRGENERFALSNYVFKLTYINNKPFIRIPKLGLVRMREELRFDGKVLSAKIFTKSDRWFVSIVVEMSGIQIPLPKTNKSIGIDLGVTDLAILSNGEKVQAPKPLKANLKKLRRLNKSLGRKQKGSSNRAKAKAKLSRLHYKISCIRKDFLHKLTSSLVSEFNTICIEDLSVKDMVKDKRLSRAISDLGFYEFKRQLIYKADIQDKTVKELDRFYPSSKTCSCCGFKLEKLPLSVRAWTCPNCKTSHDRDVNASLNILNNAAKVLTTH